MSRTFILACTLGVWLCGCVGNIDLYRPLERRKAPNYAEVVPELHTAFPDSREKDIHKSIRELWFSFYHFSSLIGYGDPSDFISFGDLQDSLQQFGDNPFAWSLLADFLALERQPAAASYAAERALDILAEVSRGAQHGLGADLSALQWTLQINMAIFLNLQGKYGEAVAELDTIDALAMQQPFLNLASTWTRCASIIELGRSDEALKLLDAAIQSAVDLPQTPAFNQLNYPQYFDTRKREAIFIFLRAEALLRLGRADEAEHALEAAIKIDPNLWVAQLSLGTSQFTQGKFTSAQMTLEKLVARRPTEGLYAFDLALFNLGNVYLETEEYSKAADMYGRVIEAANDRARHIARVIEPTLSEDVRARILNTTQSQFVAAAYNNRGAAILLAGGREAAQDAAPYFQKAELGDSIIAQSNSVHARLLTGDPQKRIETLSDAASKNPNNDKICESLLRIGLNGSNGEELNYLALRAYLVCVSNAKSPVDHEKLQNLELAAPLFLREEQVREITNRIDALSQK